MWAWLRALVDAFLGRVPGKPGRMATATRMVMDADFNERDCHTPPQPELRIDVDPLEELQRLTGQGK